MTESNVEVLKAPHAKLDENLICTVISYLPFEINEMKPGMIPGFFHIDAAVGGEPQLLHLGECMHYVYLDMERGSLTVFDPAHKVATSIVNDLVGALLCTSPGARPAIWWEHGLLTPGAVKSAHASAIEEHLQAQNRWYKALIEDADDGWARSHQHAMVSDLARLACSALDMERDWNIVITEDAKPQSQECPACRNVIFVGAVICTHCRFVLDKDGYDKLQFADLVGSAMAG